MQVPKDFVLFSIKVFKEMYAEVSRICFKKDEDKTSKV